MNTKTYKRNYHPLIILFYVYGMLDHEQIGHIPVNTRKNRNKFKHEDYDCEDWVKPFLKNFEDIKQIYMKEHLRKTMIILLTVSKGYSTILSSVTKNKILLQNNSEVIINSINKLVIVTGIKVVRACQFYGVSKDWFYREKSHLFLVLEKRLQFTNSNEIQLQIIVF